MYMGSVWSTQVSRELLLTRLPGVKLSLELYPDTGATTWQ